jgi:DNA topoisomerase III
MYILRLTFQSAGGSATKRCKCDLTAVSRTVSKEGENKGRAFWTCPNSQGNQCGFFEWDDEDGGSGQRPPPGSGGSGITCYKCNQQGHFASGKLYTIPGCFFLRLCLFMLR